MPTNDSPCSSEEHRQFDFWIGDWEVLDEAGDLQGTNQIEQILGGCALQENWVGAEGSTGHSFNTFDKNSGRWHQTWVDGNGLLLLLDGGLEEGSMVLSGPGVSRDGDPITHRISWTPLEDGRVRQYWQVFKDDWNDVFDGYYTRVD